ncbi:MAG: protein kinase [Myxococcales bacterium]|nr:protein kinase [Myxococcales bacterium]
MTASFSENPTLGKKDRVYLDEPLIHRDLKPENLFLHRSEEFGLMVKVLDFGIAMFKTRLESDELRLTQDNTLLGTPLYMAPEQVLGSREEIGPRTDVWAIGMIAYDMLVGDNYWKVPSLGMLLSRIALGHMPAPSEVVPSLPKTFDEWFFRSCSRELPTRFGSVREQVEALAAVLSVDPVWMDAVVPPASLVARVNTTSPLDQQQSVSRLAALPRAVRTNAPLGSGALTAVQAPSVSSRAVTASLPGRKPAESAPSTELAAPAKQEQAASSTGNRKRWSLLLLLLLPMIGVGLLVVFLRPSGGGNVAASAPASTPANVQPDSAKPDSAKAVPADTPSQTAALVERDRSAEPTSRSGKKASTKGRGKTSLRAEGKASSVGKNGKERSKIDYDPVAP